ncbi:MAG: hypothetical protein JNM09_00495 [Blastocatellia bacterium]|nr:hypothetical protein [Blastocatellia bacterium]
MDTILRNALLSGSLAVIVVLVGAGLFLVRPLSTIWRSRLHVFAAGALFAVLALELMPDLLIAHHFAAMSAFLCGLLLRMAMKWLTGKIKKERDDLPKPLLTTMMEALVYALMVGILMGSSFVAGVREGLLLTPALTLAALAICLVALARLGQASSSRQRVTFFLLSLAALILSGAATGATLLWGRATVDLDLLYAFGMAVLLLWALESLIEAGEDESPVHTLFFFVLGALLFIFLAGRFGRAHPDHPGRPATTTSAPYNHPPNESFTFSDKLTLEAPYGKTGTGFGTTAARLGG